MENTQGYIWTWRCICGCSNGSYTLCSERGQDDAYCQREMTNHLDWMLRELKGLPGPHNLILVSKVKGVQKWVPGDWS